MARESRVGHGRATFGPRWHEWRRLGVTAKAAVTGAGRAGIESTSRKARRGRNRAGRRNRRAMLLAEGVPALPVRAFVGHARQPQLLADGPGEEAPKRMRLPAGGLHQFLQGGAVGAFEQVQDLGGLAALADTFSFGRFGFLGRLGGLLGLGRRCGLGLAALAAFLALGCALLRAGSLLRGGLLRRDGGARFRKGGGGVGCGGFCVRSGHFRFISFRGDYRGQDINHSEVFEKQEDSTMAKNWRCTRRGCQQMSGNVTKLKPKQEEAIIALLSSRTVEDAARAVKITPRTLYRWLNEPGFAAAYRQARRTAFAQCTARLQQASNAAASVLLRVMTDAATPAAVKVRASDSVLHHAEKASEIEDIEARVAELERAVARVSRQSSAVVEWASTKALPGPTTTPAQTSPAIRLLAGPREPERNDDTDQSQAHEPVARMSDTELELRPISPEAQKAKPKGPNGG